MGILRFHVADKIAPRILELQVGQKVTFFGKIADAPDIRENNQKLTVEILAPQGLALESLKARPFLAKILVTTNFGQDLNMATR